MVLPSAVGLCSCSGWSASSESNKNVTRLSLLKHLQPLNKGPPLKFGSASEFSALAPHGSADPLHWDERDSMIIDQPLHINRAIMISPLIHFLAGLFCRVRSRSFSSYCHTALRYPETGNFPRAQSNLRHGARWR